MMRPGRTLTPGSAEKKKKYLLFFPTSVTIASVGDIAQLGEHPLDVRKVTGSNPVISTETAQQSGFFVAHSFMGHKKTPPDVLAAPQDHLTNILSPIL